MVIWHWLMAAVVILGTWVVPVYLGIRIGRTLPAMARLDYIKAFAVLVVLVVVLRAIQMNITNPISIMLIGLAFPFINYAASRRLVQRLSDAGYTPMAAWLCVIPLGNVIMYLIGCFLPHKPRQISF